MQRVFDKILPWRQGQAEKKPLDMPVEIDTDLEDEELPEEIHVPEVVEKPEALSNLIEIALSGKAPNVLMSMRQTGDSFDYALDVHQETMAFLDTIQRRVADGAVLDDDQQAQSEESRDNLFLTNFKPVIDAGFQHAMGQLELFQRGYARQLTGGELTDKMAAINHYRDDLKTISQETDAVPVDRLRQYYADFARALRDLRNSLEDTHNQIIEVMSRGESRKIDGEIAQIFLDYAQFPELPEDQTDLDADQIAEYGDYREQAVNIAFAFDSTISQADYEWWQSLSEQEQNAFRQQFEREGSSAFMHTFFLELGQLYRAQVQMQDITENVLDIIGQLPEGVLVTKKATGTATNGGSLQKDWTRLQAGLSEFFQEQQDIYNDPQKIKQLKGLISKIYDAVITLPAGADVRGPVEVAKMKKKLKELHVLLDNWIKQLDLAHRKQPLLMKNDVFLHASPEMVSLGDALADKVEAAQKALGNDDESGDSDFLAALIVGAEQASHVPKQRRLREWREDLETSISAARQELRQKQIRALEKKTVYARSPVNDDETDAGVLPNPDRLIPERQFEVKESLLQPAKIPLATADEAWQQELQAAFDAAAQQTE